VRKYILRISQAKRYGFFDKSAYCFEMDLLVFLKNNGISVASPIKRKDGTTLGVINAPEGARHYVLFTYAEGNSPENLNQTQGYLLGETLARFHICADSFFSKYSRFHLDTDYLINEPLRSLKNLSKISQDAYRFIEDVSNTLRINLKILPKIPSTYGIIHGDFWWKNVHFKNKHLTIFDFDYCGYGWRVSDIAALRGNAIIHDYDLSDTIMTAFIGGYQSIRKLEHYELDAIKYFEKITVIWAFGLWTTGIDVLGTQCFYDNFDRVFSRFKVFIESPATYLDKIQGG
jgi:Ser/Thr protein kinase RdoA (MazF antagonist)